MSLIKKIFGKEASASSRSTQFHDSEPTTAEPGSRNGPRRELVQVVLRDTIRRHGIPSDWIDCRILSVANNNKTEGMHVHLIVRKGHDRLLTYIPAFQGSFMQAIIKFDPRVADWLLSLSWQFEGMTERQHATMPDPGAWVAAPIQSAAAKAQEDEVAQDLKALFAIRDAALQRDPADFQPTRPGSKSG